VAPRSVKELPCDMVARCTLVRLFSSSMTTPRPVRHRCDLSARLEREGGSPLEVRVLDLSEAGAFIEETKGLEELQVGDMLTLVLALPGGEAWRARAIVSRLGTSRREVKHPSVAHVTVSAPGFGVELLDTTDEALEQLRDYLELLDQR
jgi:hypothetical protein